MAQCYPPTRPPAPLDKRSAYCGRSGAARSTHRLGSRPSSSFYGLPYGGDPRRHEFESRKDTSSTQIAQRCDFNQMVVYDRAVYEKSRDGDVTGRYKSGGPRSQSEGPEHHYYSSDRSSGSESSSDSGSRGTGSESEHVTVEYDNDGKYSVLLPDKVYHFVPKRCIERK